MSIEPWNCCTLFMVYCSLALFVFVFTFSLFTYSSPSAEIYVRDDNE